MPTLYSFDDHGRTKLTWLPSKGSLGFDSQGNFFWLLGRGGSGEHDQPARWNIPAWLVYAMPVLVLGYLVHHALQVHSEGLTLPWVGTLAVCAAAWAGRRWLWALAHMALGLLVATTAGGAAYLALATVWHLTVSPNTHLSALDQVAWGLMFLLLGAVPVFVLVLRRWFRR